MQQHENQSGEHLDIVYHMMHDLQCDSYERRKCEAKRSMAITAESFFLPLQNAYGLPSWATLACFSFLSLLTHSNRDILSSTKWYYYTFLVWYIIENVTRQDFFYITVHNRFIGELMLFLFVEWNIQKDSYWVAEFGTCGKKNYAFLLFKLKIDWLRVRKIMYSSVISERKLAVYLAIVQFSGS